MPGDEDGDASLFASLPVTLKPVANPVLVERVSATGALSCRCVNPKSQKEERLSGRFQTSASFLSTKEQCEAEIEEVRASVLASIESSLVMTRDAIARCLPGEARSPMDALDEVLAALRSAPERFVKVEPAQYHEPQMSPSQKKSPSPGF